MGKVQRKWVGSVAAAAGWRAVYADKRSDECTALPVAYWNQRQEVDESGLERVVTVGVVLLPTQDGFDLADSLPYFVGYIAPGEALQRWNHVIRGRRALEGMASAP